MNCKEIEPSLYLHISDDLVEEDKELVQQHLATCSNCQELFAELRKTHELVISLRDKDQIVEPASDFTARVQYEVQSRSKASRKQASRRTGLLIVGFTTVALMIVVLLRPINEKRNFNTLLENNPYLNEGSLVKWDSGSKPLDSFSAPMKLSDWKAPHLPGLVIILHQPDPEGHPDIFELEYCYEGKNLAAINRYQWRHSKTRILLDRVGSKESLYITSLQRVPAERRMRKEILLTLLNKYEPFFNNRARGYHEDI